MRPLTFAPALLMMLLAPLMAQAECACGCHTGSMIDPHRALEIATLDQRLYLRVDHPSRMRTFRAEKTFSEARIKTLNHRLRAYRPFSRDSTGGPLMVTIEQTRLELMREELHLQDLRARMTEEIRFHRDRQRLHSLRVQHAQLLVAQLQSEPIDPHAEIVITSHSE